VNTLEREEYSPSFRMCCGVRSHIHSTPSDMETELRTMSFPRCITQPGQKSINTGVTLSGMLQYISRYPDHIHFSPLTRPVAMP
jgi:hypothetical protein